MNTRFHIKNQDGNDVIMRLALLRWAENGGKITKVKSNKRPKRGFTVGKNVKIGDK